MCGSSKAEEYFFRYAFPCAWVLLKKGEISKEKYHSLEQRFFHNAYPPRKELEEVFHKAFDRIRNLAKRRKKDYWSLDIIKEYWRKEHNRIMKHVDVPSEVKELCRITKARVVAKDESKDKNIIVEYNGKRRSVYNPVNADKGDYVLLHYYHAVEKI